jgi:hypothetical protein
MTLKEVISRLPIVDENILAEAARQPELFKDAARVRVTKMRKRLAAEAAADHYEAERNLRSRARRDEQGKKPTEGEIKERTACDPKMRRLRRVKDAAFAMEELSKLLLEAYRMRRDSVRVLSEAYNIEGIKDSKEIDRVMEHRKLTSRARSLEERRRNLEREE